MRDAQPDCVVECVVDDALDERIVAAASILLVVDLDDAGAGRRDDDTTGAIVGCGRPNVAAIEGAGGIGLAVVGGSTVAMVGCSIGTVTPSYGSGSNDGGCNKRFIEHMQQIEPVLQPVY